MAKGLSIRSRARRAASVSLAILCCAAAPGLAEHETGAPAIGGVYAAGGWSTLHRSPANRKFVPHAALDTARVNRHLLEGAAVLTAPTFTPDGNTFFVTTGRGPGASNLHAFDRDGQALWSAPAFTDPASGVDPCAILSSAIVDEAGDLYLGDCNQLFAFHADGRS
ncbi:MAG: hypothetical protein AAGC67_12295, partial [Myxococcota bacterium]